MTNVSGYGVICVQTLIQSENLQKYNKYGMDKEKKGQNLKLFVVVPSLQMDTCPSTPVRLEKQLQRWNQREKSRF